MIFIFFNNEQFSLRAPVIGSETLMNQLFVTLGGGWTYSVICWVLHLHKNGSIINDHLNCIWRENHIRWGYPAVGDSVEAQPEQLLLLKPTGDCELSMPRSMTVKLTNGSALTNIVNMLNQTGIS